MDTLSSFISAEHNLGITVEIVSALSRRPILLLKIEDDYFDYFVTEPSRDKFLPYFYEN